MADTILDLIQKESERLTKARGSIAVSKATQDDLGFSAQARQRAIETLQARVTRLKAAHADTVARLDAATTQLEQEIARLQKATDVQPPSGGGGTVPPVKPVPTPTPGLVGGAASSGALASGSKAGTTPSRGKVAPRKKASKAKKKR